VTTWSRFLFHSFGLSAGVPALLWCSSLVLGIFAINRREITQLSASQQRHIMESESSKKYSTSAENIKDSSLLQ
jgi:hypothetical protein